MTPEPEAVPAEGGEPELAPYKIEQARSSRSRCRTCRTKIEKGVLRLGILLEGPYGTGYLWHHLKCAAKRRMDDVEAAYGERAWAEGLALPELDELRKLKLEAEQAVANKKLAPYVERAPSGRSKCKHCGELIEKDSHRVALLREVAFGNQVRSAPVNVHPACVTAEIRAEDCATESEGFEQALRANSRGVEAADVDAVLLAIGDLG